MKSRKTVKLIIFALLLTLSISVFVTGCGSTTPEASDPIVIGSKQFAESYILGHMAAIMIEEKTDLTVDTSKKIGRAHV